MKKSSWTSERARYASLSRSRVADDPELLAARRRLKVERLAEYIEQVVEEAPPLTTEERDRLAVLLHGDGDAGRVLTAETAIPQTGGAA